MTTGRKPTEQHRVVTGETVFPDGTRAPVLNVFCSRRGETVPIEACGSCAAYVDVVPGPHRVGVFLRCRPEEDGGAEGEPGTAAQPSQAHS